MHLSLVLGRTYDRLHQESGIGTLGRDRQSRRHRVQMDRHEVNRQTPMREYAPCCSLCCCRGRTISEDRRGRRSIRRSLGVGQDQRNLLGQLRGSSIPFGDLLLRFLLSVGSDF